MRLEWLEDLIALAEADSLTEAALRRHVTQPAFSRRVQNIEQRLGFSVLNRTRRPARATEALRRRLPELREVVSRLHSVERSLASEAQPGRVVIAAQHSLNVSLIPRALTRIREQIRPANIRLRSANHAECHSLLMTHQAVIMASYDTHDFPAAPNELLLEKIYLQQDRLLPVAAPGLFAGDSPGEGEALPLIGYPTEAYFGAILAARLLPQLHQRYRITETCETALTPAQLELALNRWGVAWLPQTMAREALDSGRLLDLSAPLGEVPMRVALLRLRTPHAPREETVWHALINALGEPQSESPPPFAQLAD